MSTPQGPADHLRTRSLVSCGWFSALLANNPPGEVALLWPQQDATDAGVHPVFGWTLSTDPDGNAVQYVVYCDSANPPVAVLGTTNNATLAAGGRLTGSLTPESDLAAQTTYYWRVRASDSQGSRRHSDYLPRIPRSLIGL